MKDLHYLYEYRLRGAEEDFARRIGQSIGPPSTTGIFAIPHPHTGVVLRVLASAGEGWDHVSVSLANRCPNWPEMQHVARMFFKDDETAMQLHVPAEDHVNCHPYCLHWWRPQTVAIPRPPKVLVGGF